MQVLLDRAQAVVAGDAAPLFHPHDARLEVELVMDDHDPRDLARHVAASKRPEGETRVVHVGLRDGERQSAWADPHDRRVGVRAPLTPQAGMVPVRHEAHGFGAVVVARAGVLGSGVAETDGEQVGGGACNRARCAASGEPQLSPAPSSPAAAAWPAPAASPGAAPPSAAASSSGRAMAWGPWPIATAWSGSTSVVTPSGSDTSPTRIVWPIDSSEMSTSRWAGRSAGRAFTSRVLSSWPTVPPPRCTSIASPTRRIGTSAEMISSLLTTWKSTWVTVWRTGRRCSWRATARR